MPVFVMTHFIRNGWPRANYAHLSAQNVNYLWELVDGIAPHPAPDPGDSRIVFNLAVDRSGCGSLVRVLAVDGAPHQLSVHLIVNTVNHRSKLDHQKNAAIHANALLFQNTRTP